VKILPCLAERSPGASACNDGLARLADGSVYWMESFPNGDGRAYRYQCAGCKRTTTLTVAEFVRLPDATVEELQGHGVLDHLLQDMLGQELHEDPDVARDRALDLFRAGFVTTIDPSIPPPEKAP
jgi:hypothetical protein